MSRIDMLRKLFRAPRSFVFDQQNQANLGDAEQQAGFELMVQSGHLLKKLKQELDDAQTAKLEQDEVRAFSARVREFGLRHHLTVARPLWGWPSLQEDSSSLAYVGGDDLLPLVTEICEPRRLSLVARGSGWGAGQERWNQLRKSPVCVFDFRDGDPLLRASVAYSLGCALALGVIPVVASSNPELPFDIDLPPTVLDGSDDATVLAEAIDRAFFHYPSVGAMSSARRTLTELAAQASGDDATTRVLRQRIAEGHVRDPLDARGVAFQLLASSGDAELALLTPIWPGFYPETDSPRCFHVMPFSYDWSDTARESARQACKAAGVAYRRGDESDEDRIIRAIWEEICRADSVLVDISGLNANVCLELGLTHALGKNTLIVSRDEPSKKTLFPEIRKLQVAQYEASELGSLVESFLKG
jgi:hypothetical protein